MKKVYVRVADVDDGVTVTHNGTEILHVHYMQQGSRVFNAQEGDIVSFIIHNMTGGDWHANLMISVDNEIKYNETPRGSSFIGQWNAYSHDVIV
ncbi:MAG: hypothetical protein IT236_12850 [Bacteroidia bacterium]|nr:hypothetical protein [Bacteroidia bacterium]